MLIKILEHYFLESSFPDTAKRYFEQSEHIVQMIYLGFRMEIANACNQILLRDKKGSQLAAKEIVTPQVCTSDSPRRIHINSSLYFTDHS